MPRARRSLTAFVTSLAIALVLLAATTRGARADEPRDDGGERYAGPVVAADLASWAAIVAAAFTDGDAAETGLASIGIVGLTLGAPAVHLAQGEHGAMAKSLALRFLAPSAAFAAATAVAGETAGAIAAVSSMIVVQIYDAFSLARRTPKRRTIAGRLLVPDVLVGDGAVRVGVTGRF